MKRKLLTSIGALLFLGAATSVSMAASNSSNMNVTIKIVEGCAVTANDMDFRQWANLLSPHTTTTTVSVTCNVGPGQTSSGTTIANTYKVTLSPGKSANQTMREMRNTSGNAIKYNIYLNSNYTSVFGDGTGGTSNLEGTVSATANDTYTVYGRTQVDTNNPTPGDYVDNLTLTVSF